MARQRDVKSDIKKFKQSVKTVNKLRKDVEEANIQQESILSNLKRKQGDATAEMTEQVLPP